MRRRRSFSASVVMVFSGTALACGATRDSTATAEAPPAELSQPSPVSAEPSATAASPTASTPAPVPSATQEPEPKRVVITPSNPPPPTVLYFDAGSTKIRKDGEPLLNEVVNVLKGHPEVIRVVVAGHDDPSSGKAALRLSKARADSVIRWLVEKGADAKVLRGVGFAGYCPISTGTGAEDRARNRRVEFRVEETKDGPTNVELGCEPARAAGITGAP